MRAHRLVLPALCLLAACSNPAAPTHAQQPAPPMPEADRRVPTDSAAIKLSFAPVVRKAAPAVVNVYSRRVMRQQIDPFWGMFGGGMGLSRDRVAQSLGSGVIVRGDGVIVTNNHVIAGGQEIMVVLSDRREFPAKVLLADAHSDIAVLKIDIPGERLPTLALDDHDDNQIGDLVLAIGDPFGVGQTVTNGIVSALARTGVGQGDAFYIQTDAAINPGNSGGALVNMNGDMIGMNSAILSQSGTSSGVGFAIPAALIKRVVENAVGGAISASAGRPWLGVKTQAVTAEIARSLGLDRPTGVLITDVYPGGPGARAGLRQGDLILSADGATVDDEAALNYHVLTHRSGETVVLQVRHEHGALATVSVRVAPPPGGEGDAGAGRVITGSNPFSGATVIDLTPAAADQLGLDPFAARAGVLVTKLDQGVAAGIGVQPGDIIKEVNGHPITSAAQLQSVLGAGGSVWRFILVRDGQEISAQVRL